MTMQWVSADLRTGRVLADLPSLEAQWPLRRTIGRYETGTAKLHLDGAPPDWEWAVREGGALLACYDDDDTTGAVQWAGYITGQTRDTENDAVDLALVTPEGYLDRRFVRRITADKVPQCTLAAGLVLAFATTDGGGPLNAPGLPFALDYVLDQSEPLKTRVYADNDNATVYARLSQLMAVRGGPEWTVSYAWALNNTAIMPTFKVRNRLGTPRPIDREPDALFDMPGCVIQAVQVRDYSDGKGANVVRAYSSGEGDSVPSSGDVIVDDPARRPAFEYRWQPSSSITDTTTLRDYAQSAGALLAPGARTLALVAHTEDAPRLGDVWQLGDDVAYSIGGIGADGQDTVRMFPGGLTGYGRAIAVEIDGAAGTIAPILAEDAIYSDEGEAA